MFGTNFMFHSKPWKVLTICVEHKLGAEHDLGPENTVSLVFCHQQVWFQRDANVSDQLWKRSKMFQKMFEFHNRLVLWTHPNT